MNTTATFARIERATRTRTEGQQQRLDRRAAERERQAGRRQGRNAKRAQAGA